MAFAVIVAYLISIGMAYGVALRILPREDKWHYGGEDVSSGPCAGNASCLDCQISSALIASVWPLAIVTIAAYHVARTIFLTGLWIARIGARITSPDKPIEEAE
jgi:hypothetical protein